MLMGLKRIMYIILIQIVYIFLYFEKKLWDVIEYVTIKTTIFHELFSAAKINFFLRIDEYGAFEEHKTFEGFTDSQKLLDRNQCVEMLQGDKINLYSLGRRIEMLMTEIYLLVMQNVQSKTSLKSVIFAQLTCLAH